MFRALRSMVYTAVMGGIHDALKDAGIVEDGATGTMAEQVRGAIADKTAPTPQAADENDERAARGRGKGAK